MIKIGLTGSIATGKTFVCNVFSELGCHVLDADKVSRDVVARGTVGLHQIIDEFGEGILLPTGDLDRKKLGTLVFGDESKRRALNSIVHPLVIENQDRWIAELEPAHSNGIAIIDAALMIESGGYKRLDKLIVVWCEPAIQLKRLTLRDNLSDTDARIRIAAQLTQDEKKRFADYLIDTSAGFADTRRQTVGIFEGLVHSD